MASSISKISILIFASFDLIRTLQLFIGAQSSRHKRSFASIIPPTKQSSHLSNPTNPPCPYIRSRSSHPDPTGHPSILTRLFLLKEPDGIDPCCALQISAILSYILLVISTTPVNPSRTPSSVNSQ
ncbi:hypothetical protein BDQ12DRAFT_677017 [Crucibulum laeve]|uniref:Uncharacterized protein n=1 Tax=Crucibulum laeve TaxID=68775 RepID=A0A5C3MC59_9AGAR|nr:hypothetical protein BDQ12DRAFT_677017 [Crucibulum laeve]